jgi:hypothetical protein
VGDGWHVPALEKWRLVARWEGTEDPQPHPATKKHDRLAWIHHPRCSSTERPTPSSAFELALVCLACLHLRVHVYKHEHSSSNQNNIPGNVW